MKRYKHPRSLVLLLAVLLGAVSLPATAAYDPLEKYYGDADRSEFEDYDESQDKPWQESRLGELQMPDDASLLEVEIDRLPPGLKLFIDPGSVRLDEKDGVVRMWLVARSAAGAYNATFEGFRCETREYKVYAYGNPRREPRVRAAPKPVWKSLGGNTRFNYRRELARTLLCGMKGGQPVADIIATLKGQRDYLRPAESNSQGF